LNTITDSQDTGTHKITSGEDLTTSEEENYGKKEPIDCRKKQICKESTPNRIWRGLMNITRQEAEDGVNPEAVVLWDEEGVEPQQIESQDPPNRSIRMNEPQEEETQDLTTMEEEAEIRIKEESLEEGGSDLPADQNHQELMEHLNQRRELSKLRRMGRLLRNWMTTRPKIKGEK
jgi:hypothetical protein